jgi:putative peptidoglycan lipid II flippase
MNTEVDTNLDTTSVPAPETETHTHATDEESASVARATGVIALGNIASRVLGLGREMLLTNLFGASLAVDAFNIAIIVPKTLYDLLIGGHVNSAIVPVLSEYAMQKDRTGLWRLVNLLLGMLVVILALLVLILELLAPQVIQLVSGTPPLIEHLLSASLLPVQAQQFTVLYRTQAIAVTLLRITTPALLFMSLFAVLSGLLYALRRFTLPAFAGAAFNGSIVLVTLIAAPTLGIAAMALGWLVGALVQMVMQMAGLREAHLRLRLKGLLSEPGVRRIALLYLPVMFSLVVDTLVIRLVSYRLAAQVGEASITYMNLATTLMQFPHGLVATAISVAILPTLSRQAVLLSTKGVDVYKNTLGRGLRLAIMLILPATIGIFVLASPLIDLLFEHGLFTTTDTAVTALALRLYLLGLPFATIDLLLVFAFYSQQDTLTPAIIGIISLSAYLAVALGLMPIYGLFSLMIADSIKHLLHTSIAGWLLSKRIGGFRHQRLPLTTLKTLIVSLVMGVVASFSLAQLLTILPQNIIGEAGLVIIPAGVGVVVFAGMAALFRIEELYWLLGLIKQRFSR